MHDDGRTPAAGGAGLFDKTTRHAFPSWANAFAGFGALAVVFAVGWLLYQANPAFSAGTALGTANQIAKPKAGEIHVVAGTPAAEGKKVIGAKCGGCHVVPGISAATGHIGPDLAGVGSKTVIAGGAVQITSPDDLKRWVMDPPSMKPGTQMPNLGLTDEEGTQVTAYLELLK